MTKCLTYPPFLLFFLFLFICVCLGLLGVVEGVGVAVIRASFFPPTHQCPCSDIPLYTLLKCKMFDIQSYIKKKKKKNSTLDKLG